MTGRCDWIPLSIEYLADARDRAKAAGDMETLALLREISRLHWMLIVTNQVVDFTLGAYGDRTRERGQELRALLDKEPLIIKRKSIWTVRLPSPGEPPGKQ